MWHVLRDILACWGATTLLAMMAGAAAFIIYLGRGPRQG
jgi:hypothetical protein